MKGKTSGCAPPVSVCENWPVRIAAKTRSWSKLKSMLANWKWKTIRCNQKKTAARASS
jgi:hypothetical protein